MKKMIIFISSLCYIFLFSNFSIVKANTEIDNLENEMAYSDFYMWNGFVYDINQFSNYVIGGNQHFYTNSFDHGFVEVFGNDPIVMSNIIPEEYFTNKGSYVEIGEEYGFYVYTKPVFDIERAKTNVSYVILFDIEREWIDASRYKTSLTIVGQHEYITFMEDEVNFAVDSPEYWYMLYNNVQYYSYKTDFPFICPVIDYYDGYKSTENLCISSVGMSVSFENLYNLNIGDEGYVFERDNGLFINNSNLSYESSEIKEIIYSNFDLNIIIEEISKLTVSKIFNGITGFVLKQIFGEEGSEAILQLGEYAHEYINILMNGYDKGKIEIESSEIKNNIVSYNVQELQHLIKNAGALIETKEVEEGSKLLYKPGETISLTVTTSYNSLFDIEKEYNNYILSNFMALKFSLINGLNIEPLDMGFFENKKSYNGNKTKGLDLSNCKEQKVNFVGNVSELFYIESSETGYYYFPFELNGYNISIKNSNYDQIYFTDSYSLNDIFLLEKGKMYYVEIWKDVKSSDLYDDYIVEKVIQLNLYSSDEYLLFSPSISGYYCINGDYLGFNVSIRDLDHNLVYYIENYNRNKTFFLTKGKEYLISVWKDEEFILGQMLKINKYTPIC